MVSDGTCLSATTFQTGFVSTKEGCTSWTISTHHTSNHQYFKPPTTENPLFICPPFQPPTLQDRYIYIYACLGRKKHMNHYRKLVPVRRGFTCQKADTYKEIPSWIFFSHPSPLAYLFVYHHHSGKNWTCWGLVRVPLSHWFHPTSPNISQVPMEKMWPSISHLSSSSSNATFASSTKAFAVSASSWL